MTATVDNEKRVADHFAYDTSGHQMTVLLNQGVYRHLRFQAPTTSNCWFTITTWPGVLCISGDHGCYVFSRLHDMFEFFEGDRGRLNLSYWAEKVTAGRDQLKTYSPEVFTQLVTEHVDDWCLELTEDQAAELRAAVNEDVLDEETVCYEDLARQALSNFSHRVTKDDLREFYDTWEWDFSEYDFHYIWCCHAIIWALKQYRAAGDVDALSAAPSAVESVSVAGEVL